MSCLSFYGFFTSHIQCIFSSRTMLWSRLSVARVIVIVISSVARHVLSRTGTYWHVLARTGTYWHVLSRTVTYCHVVIPPAQIWINRSSRIMNRMSSITPRILYHSLKDGKSNGTNKLPDLRSTIFILMVFSKDQQTLHC